MNEIQILEFIEIYSVKEILFKSFNSVIENNTCEDLNISNSNITIDLTNIEYDFKNNSVITFKCHIIDEGKKVGFYSVVLEQTGKLIDDFFVIY